MKQKKVNDRGQLPVNAPADVRRASAEGAPSEDALAAYMSGLSAYGVLGAEGEVALARQIEALDLAHWATLIDHAPAYGVIARTLAQHIELPPELTRLKRPTRARPSPRADARRRAAVEAAARAIRERDVARVALAEVDLAVREACADDPAFLQRAARARAAQRAAKNQFMTANLRLVIALARRYESNKLMPLADLIQEGNLGLMRAVERFDYRRGFRFSTYGAWWIRHALNRALSDKARLVRLPVHLLDDAQRVTRALSELIQEHGRTPTERELAERSGLGEEKLAFVQRHASLRAPSSLDQPLGDDPDGHSMQDVTADPDLVAPEEALDAARWSDSIAGLMTVLAPIEASILRYRFGLDDGETLTLQEIGERYNLSRERIRQIQERALDKLRAELARTGETRTDKRSAA